MSWGGGGCFPPAWVGTGRGFLLDELLQGTEQPREVPLTSTWLPHTAKLPLGKAGSVPDRWQHPAPG